MSKQADTKDGLRENAIDTIDEIRGQDLLTAQISTFRRELEIADALDRLSNALTDDVLRQVVKLRGKNFGFRTDRDAEGTPYDIGTVREVFVEATIRGYKAYGNEFNIIAGKFYATLEGLTRKVAEYPGLTDLKLVPGIPQMKEKGALVEFHATWKIDGKLDQIHCNLNANAGSDTRIPVRVNAKMGVDAILGKARRKMLARIYQRLTGSEMSLGDDQGDTMPDVDSPAQTQPQLFENSRVPVNDSKGRQGASISPKKEGMT